MGIFLKKFQVLTLSFFLGAALPAFGAGNDLSQAQTHFGLSFFKEILKENPGQNTLVSPYSAFTALGMLYNGAAGSTKAAMAQAMGLDSMKTSDLNQGTETMQETLEKTDPKAELDIANSLWENKNYPIKPNFVKTNQTYYHAEVNSLDFSQRGASDKVNQWVSDKTKGKIPFIIGSLTKQDVLVLVNAIYFKGLWASKFKKEETKPQVFHLSDNTTQDRDFMHQTLRLPYLVTKDFQAVKIPYDGNHFSLMVFLPAEGSNLINFFESLTPENWNNWMSHFGGGNVVLSLPKFKIEFEKKLIPALTDMGMKVAFDARTADFSRIGRKEDHLYVNQVVQKTYMLVDEEGTEAAAATAIVVKAMVVEANPPPLNVMTVDRPFFVALVDNQTKAILFTGAIYDPK